MTFHIGHIPVADPVFLAPMSGVTDLPFRRTVKSFGAGLVFSEMIASRSVIEEWRSNVKIDLDYGQEFPMAVQLAGCEPEVMAEAARINTGRGAAIIDINFGCPVKKIVNSYAGSALMRDEDLAVRIIDAVVAAVDVPVTVKMRLGWDENSLNAPSLAARAEASGVKMVTVHGRTRCQLYNGQADWHAVRKVREAVTVPLVVNGDILTPEDAAQAMEISGANGAMIGRGCYGRPWMLRDTAAHLKGAAKPAAPSPQELLALIEKHYADMLVYYGTKSGVQIARKHLAWYLQDLPGGPEIKPEINKLDDPAAVVERLRAFFAALQSAVS
ncbi:MAG: tRNA dihydrouridine synthase DusB [Alphaproteobacteria bacterium]